MMFVVCAPVFLLVPPPNQASGFQDRVSIFLAMALPCYVFAGLLIWGLRRRRLMNAAHAQGRTVRQYLEMNPNWYRHCLSWTVPTAVGIALALALLLPVVI